MIAELKNGLEVLGYLDLGDMIPGKEPEALAVTIRGKLHFRMIRSDGEDATYVIAPGQPIPDKWTLADERVRHRREYVERGAEWARKKSDKGKTLEPGPKKAGGRSGKRA